VNLSRIVAGYRLFFCALLLFASLQTLLTEGAVSHVVPLASVEFAGALLLAWRRTQELGLAVLLIVFACAQLLAAHQGAWPTRFVQYAGSALLIVLLERALRAARAMPPAAGTPASTAR
jgi:hypothetical protein